MTASIVNVRLWDFNITFILRLFEAISKTCAEIILRSGIERPKHLSQFEGEFRRSGKREIALDFALIPYF